MTGYVEELQKESFWKEHQDSLVKIRQDLVSRKKSRPKFTPVGGIRKQTQKKSTHPPYGKYRRTPSPYLPKLSPEPAKATKVPVNGVYKSKFEKIPPVRAKNAFLPKTPDYDSWGEESSNDDDYLDDDDDEEEKIEPVRKKHRHRNSVSKRYKPQPYKPQPYPPNMYLHPQVIYGAPYSLYYPPPPAGARKNKNNAQFSKSTSQKYPRKVSRSGIPVRKKKMISPVHHSVPVYPAAYPMVPTVMFQQDLEETEETEEEDENMKLALAHWKNHPLFASDFCNWFIDDCLNTDLLPDFLIDILHEIKYMPYDHPLFLPSIYTCEDILSDHVAEMALEIVRETASELANDYIDEKLLQEDPLEKFLSDLIEDAVRMGARDIVRSSVIEIAEDYVQTEFSTGVINSLLHDHMMEIGPELLEELTFDIIAEDFIDSEVISSEVKEEAEVIARETIQYYDDKVLRREFKEVSTHAREKLTDTVIMEYLLKMMSQHGHLWAETDHHNKFLDDMIFNTSLAQIFNVHKQREKTLQCKPLQKLHEKVVSDVALDVFLQHLTLALDEDLADVDEYERGVTDSTSHPFPLSVR
ncbi:uncharacterized protein LOC131942104 [Physella acuta]|uniref:uncharacterized protein LOC131942104 n=1 Tax=Physella acuta TaxID=109671 RepID=UPI0027DC9655|nr:uncharacterized protein LOC131942104 [Physella acuta]